MRNVSRFLTQYLFANGTRDCSDSKQLNLIRLIYTAESRYSGFHTVETSKFWFVHSVDGATENEQSSTQVRLWPPHQRIY